METSFRGFNGLRIAADVLGDEGAPCVLFLHGGGQTRHSWGASATMLAEHGYRVTSVDLRGHGDSGWATDADYSLDAYASDVVEVSRQLPERPALVGASMGGLSSIVAAGELSRDEPLCWGLVLVDVSVKVKPGGSKKVRGFTRAAPNGFASLEEAAEAVAAYLPHRKRPPSPKGLLKNLRLGGDGRYRWHWDPARLENGFQASAWPEARLTAAAGNLLVPTLLAYGDRSEIVGENEVAALLELVPHAETARIENAHHMVAGDENTPFAAAVTAFLQRAREETASPRD